MSIWQDVHVPPSTTAAAPGRTPGAVSRDDVLDAAMRLLSDGGAEALSMRRLAGELGVSTQVVYSRVGGKPEVARALHDRGFEQLHAKAALLAEVADTREAVHAVAQFYFDHAVEDPMRFELMFGTPVKEFVRDDAAHAVEVSCFAATWIASVRHHLDATDPARQRGTAVRLAWRLWTAVHGITTVHLAGHSSPDDDPAAELHTIVDLLLDAGI